MYVILLTSHQIETTTILRFTFSFYNLNDFNNTSIPYLLEYWYSASRSERSSNIQKISQSLTNLYQLLIHNLCVLEDLEEEEDWVETLHREARGKREQEPNAEEEGLSQERGQKAKKEDHRQEFGKRWE